MRAIPLVLLVALLHGEGVPPAVAWAVVQSTDHAGTHAVALIGLSQASATAPEVKALQQSVIAAEDLLARIRTASPIRSLTQATRDRTASFPTTTAATYA